MIDIHFVAKLVIMLKMETTPGKEIFFSSNLSFFMFGSEDKLVLTSRTKVASFIL